MDKNQNHDDGVRLEFDVMHDSEPRPESSGPPKIKKRVTEPASQPEAPSDYDRAEHEQADEGKGQGMLANILHVFANPKVLYISGVIIVLGVGGYFGYQWYANKPEPDNTEEVMKDKGPTLPTTWLESNFLTNLCTQEDVCGPEADPDRDGLTNLEEYNSLTNPNLIDSDFDGISDIDETQVYLTDPIVMDSDGDGFEDGVEIRNGYSPNSNVDAPASSLELQVIQDNISKFGLKQATSNFLSLEKYVKEFQLSDGIPSVKIYLARPAGWQVEESPDLITFFSPDGVAIFSLKYLSSDSTSFDLQSHRSTSAQASGFELLSSYAANTSKKSFLFDEFTVRDNSSDNSEISIKKVAVLLVFEGKVFEATFEAPTVNWPNYTAFSGNLFKGVIVWPF